MRAPTGLTYKPFQREGIAKMQQALEAGWGFLLADDMGLGKSVQVLGLINEMGLARVLVLCPSTAVHNWAREAQRWLMDGHYIHTVDTPRWQVTDERVFVVMAYDKVRSDGHLSRLRAYAWDLLVCDEARACKEGNWNQAANRILGYSNYKDMDDPESGMGLRHRARHVICLDGTPLPNARPMEILPLLVMTDHNIYPAWNEGQFFQRYCNFQHKGARHLEELQGRIGRAPNYLRRLKDEVLTDLPVQEQYLVSLDENGIKIASAVDFAALPLEDDSKIAFEAMAELRQQTAWIKVPLVIRWAKVMLETENKLVLFWHHEGPAQACAKELADYEAVALTGTMSLAERAAAVDRFQRDPACRVIVLTFGVGCSAITLTAARIVAFAETEPRPDTVQQAADRVRRIGQTRTVQVYYLVVQDEHGIDARLARICGEKLARNKIVFKKSEKTATSH